MLLIKIMSNQDIDDSCQFKNYSIVTVNEKDKIQFGEFGTVFGNAYGNDPGVPDVMLVIRADGSQEPYSITGNVYIMNEQGKTISSRLTKAYVRRHENAE